MRWFAFTIAIITVANAYERNHHHHHQYPHHHHNHHGGHRVSKHHNHGYAQSHHPRYPHDIPPQHMIHNSPGSPSYRTLNPMSQVPPRSGRSQSSPPQSAQLIASASNTPVLVLKKDHARPVLSSAVVGPSPSTPPVAEKRSSQDQQEQKIPLPTVIMERPSVPSSPPTPQQQQKSSASQNTQPETPQHHTHQKPKETRRSVEELEENDEENPQMSEETEQASAERRMFFNAMQSHKQEALQVAGPQRSSKPNTKILAQGSSIQSQNTRGHQQQQNHHHHQNEEDEHQRRAAATYHQGSLPFEYPPPQGNYVSHGPIKAPVRYQQGVSGGRPHHAYPQQQHHGPHQNQQQQPQQQHKPRPRPRPQQQQQQQQPGSASEELLSEEEEEQTPDRLQELLAKSTFTCDGKKDGYYSDDTVNCEVFHYCQANTKHSWSCPESFIFHQIHLICVPPSSDNICKQSSQFHFVNEYLYRPINEKEAERTNASLKYADRYFPDSVNGAGDVVLPYHEQSNESEDETYPAPKPYHPGPTTHHHAAAHSQTQRPRPQGTPYTPYSHSQSRPQGYPQGFQPSLQYHPGANLNKPSHQTQHQGPLNSPHRVNAYAQQRSGAPSSGGATHKGSKPNVFYSPDSVNIPLQSRRPVPNGFKPSPQAPHQEYEY